MSDNLKQVKLKMLNEYEKLIDAIYDNYHDETFTFSQALYKIRNYSSLWDCCRLDLKNNGVASNSIELTEYGSNINITYPAWFEDAKGKGCKIDENSGNTSFKFQCHGKGNLRFSFRGNDYRDLNNRKVRVPIYIYFTELKINDVSVLDENTLSWHNDPIVIDKECDDNEIFSIKLQYDTIFTYYPKIKEYVDSIDTREDILVYQEKIKNYITYEKISLELNEIDNGTSNLYDYLNENDLHFDKGTFASYDSFKGVFYNYNNFIKLTNKINELNNKIDDLENKLDKYEKDTDKILDSNNSLFNNIYLDYEFKPKKLMNNVQTLCSELLLFVDNICKKHEIDWWLDYGNLLGAVRHDYFIPWDDDMDIGMMRKDYHKFIEVLYDEIKNHEMNDCINVYYRYRKANNKVINSFVQFFVMDKKRKKVMAGLDVFPYDFMKDQDLSGLGPQYNKSQTNFYNNLTRGSKRSAVYMGLDYDDVIGKLYSELGLTYEKQKFIIPGVEGSFSYGKNLYELAVFETDEIFPLDEVQFGNHTFPSPKNYDYYLTQIYGDYMKIPKSVRSHSRVNNFRNIEGIDETFEYYIDRFKTVNNDF